MTVLRRRALTLVALAATFGGGWTAGRGSNAHASRPDVSAIDPALAPGAGGPAPSCTDPLAMEANANLVGQVHDYRGRLAAAEQRAKSAERERARAAEVPPARLVTSPAEWARMAREGTIHVRVPCSRPEDGGHFMVRRPRQGGMGVGRAIRNGEMRSRAELAGLSPQELETLGEAYGRAHTRTWAAMRSACEANESFREAMEARDQDDPLTDEQRIDHCRVRVLDVDDPSTRAALTRVAELHAAGAGIERTANDEQRVAFALANAPAALFAEMVGTLGREKTTRAIDAGILCLHETVFDLRGADADEG